MIQESEDPHVHDWDWFYGEWRIEHRRLTQRLAGCMDWETFGGWCRVWPTLGGLGNIDDNVIDLPGGSYRAITLRAFDRETQRWAIWWQDGRAPHALDQPVYGRFENGTGVFLGDDTLDGRPIKVRFQWLQTATGAPRWEQAFSDDGGRNWETNWIMQFYRLEHTAGD